MRTGTSARIRVLAAAAFAVLGCEQPASDGSGASLAPSPGSELAVTDSEHDELLPDVGERGVVFLRVSVDESRLGPAEELPDCLSTLLAEACRWEVVHALPATRIETVLDTEKRPQTGPKIDAHRVFWARQRDGQTDIRMHDLQLGTTETLSTFDPGALRSGLLPMGDNLFWAGHLSGAGTGLVRTELETGTSYLAAEAPVQGLSFNAPPWARDLARPEQLSTDGKRAVYSHRVSGEWVLSDYDLETGEGGLLGITPGGEAVDSTSALHPAVRGAAVVWKAYARSRGCHELHCDLVLHGAVGDEPPHRMANAGARPSRYTPLVLDDSRLYWLDFRTGAYDIYARDLESSAATDERLTSNEAVLSAYAPFALYEGRLVWMDFRNGNWDVYQKQLR